MQHCQGFSPGFSSRHTPLCCSRFCSITHFIKIQTTRLTSILVWLTQALSKGQANGTTEEPRLRTHTRIAPSSHECLPVCRRTHSVLVHSRHTKVPMHKNQTHQPTTSRIPGRSPHQTSSEPLSLRARCQRQPSQQQRPKDGESRHSVRAVVVVVKVVLRRSSFVDRAGVPSIGEGGSLQAVPGGGNVREGVTLRIVVTITIPFDQESRGVEGGGRGSGASAAAR